jgi:hypothetical protein
MIDYVLTFQLNSVLGLLLYWLPLVLCVIGYTVRTWKDYNYELERREQSVKDRYTYYPNLTLGVVVGRIFSSVVPVFNILALVFSIGGPMLRSIAEFVHTVFSMPLVRPHDPKR